MIAIYNITPYYTKITNHKHAKNHLQNAQKQGNNLFFRRISHLLVYQLQLPAHVPPPPPPLPPRPHPRPGPGPGSGPFISMLPENRSPPPPPPVPSPSPSPFISILPENRPPPPPAPTPLSPSLGSLFFDDLNPPRGKTLKRLKSRSRDPLLSHSFSRPKKLRDIVTSSELEKIERSDQIKSDELFARFLQDHPSAMP